MRFEILVWLLSVPLIAVLHEAGHAVCARPAGYRLTSFGIGHGKPLLRWRAPSGVIVYLGRWLFSGGLCVAIPLDPVPRRRWLYHSGGLLAQGLLAVVLWYAIPHLVWLEQVFWFNAIVIAWNLVPWRFRGFASDGWQLLSSRLAPGRAGQFFSGRHQVERVLDLERQNGSPLGTAWSELMLRWMDVATGQEERALVLDEVLVLTEPKLEALSVYVTMERHRTEGRPLAALTAVRELRRALRTELPEVAGDMLTLAEARAWNGVGEPSRARMGLARLAGVEGVLSQDALAVELAAAVALEELDEVERGAERLSRRILGPFLDPVDAVHTLNEAARFLKERGRLEQAEGNLRAARLAASRVIGSAVGEDKLAIARRLGAVAGVEIGEGRAIL